MEVVPGKVAGKKPTIGPKSTRLTELVLMCMRTSEEEGVGMGTEMGCTTVAGSPTVSCTYLMDVISKL